MNRVEGPRPQRERWGAAKGIRGRVRLWLCRWRGSAGALCCCCLDDSTNTGVTVSCVRSMCSACIERPCEAVALRINKGLQVLDAAHQNVFRHRHGCDDLRMM